MVVLHGGPGGGCSPYLRRFFDPQHFRIILFDQRGAGRSRPLASITDNDTERLLGDLEVLRRHLKVDRWLLFGGSWGSTLALAYASRFPAAVAGMVLRGIFLCRPQDLDWLYQPFGAARLFPEGWQQLLSQAPPGQGSVLSRYYQGLQGDQARHYARPWCNWESLLAASPLAPEGKGSDDELCMARQETHYFMHGGYLARPLLEACRGLAMPVEIVHGRQDFVCPADQALALHGVLTNSHLDWVEQGGHSSADPAIAAALLAAVKRMTNRMIA